MLHKSKVKKSVRGKMSQKERKKCIRKQEAEKKKKTQKPHYPKTNRKRGVKGETRLNVLIPPLSVYKHIRRKGKNKFPRSTCSPTLERLQHMTKEITWDVLVYINIFPRTCFPNGRSLEVESWGFARVFSARGPQGGWLSVTVLKCQSVGYFFKAICRTHRCQCLFFSVRFKGWALCILFVRCRIFVSLINIT